jgi:hypothetical protein
MDRAYNFAYAIIIKVGFPMDFKKRNTTSPVDPSSCTPDLFDCLFFSYKRKTILRRHI